jgi:hypothetical protein
VKFCHEIEANIAMDIARTVMMLRKVARDRQPYAQRFGDVPFGDVPLMRCPPLNSVGCSLDYVRANREDCGVST